MLNKIELYLNIIHYCLYKLDYKMHLISNKLNPFLLIGKIPSVKKKFEDQRTTHLEVSNKIWTDKRFGFGVMISGGGLVLVIFLLILAIFDLFNFLLGFPVKLELLAFVFCSLSAYVICHYSVFKDDKYLIYFKQFEKWKSEKKWLYCIISFCFIIGTVGLFIFSFRFLPT